MTETSPEPPRTIVNPRWVVAVPVVCCIHRSSPVAAVLFTRLIIYTLVYIYYDMTTGLTESIGHTSAGKRATYPL